MYSCGLDGNAAMDELNANGCLRFEVNGEEVVLNREDLADRYCTDGRICI